MKVPTIIMLLVVAIYSVASDINASRAGMKQCRIKRVQIDTTNYILPLDFPDSLTCYYDIKDSSDNRFSHFSKVVEPVNDFIKRDIKAAIMYLDTMSMMRIQSDTIFDITYVPINSYRTNYSYCKNSSGIISINGGCRIAEAGELSALEIEFMTENEDSLSRIIRLSPEETLNALLLSWDIDALELYLKCALPKYTSIYATRAIVKENSITDIQKMKITSAEVYRLGGDTETDDKCDDDDFNNDYKRFMRDQLHGNNRGNFNKQ